MEFSTQNYKKKQLFKFFLGVVVAALIYIAQELIF